MKIFDGLTNVINKLANRRNPQANNVITKTARLADTEARAMFNSGLGSRIIGIKAGYSLNETLQFSDESHKELFGDHLEKCVKMATRYMLGFGRGIIVVNEIGSDLRQPLSAEVDYKNTKLDVFSGDMINITEVSRDLGNRRYLKPKYYNVNGFDFHHTRVIDFTYVMPSEIDLPEYRYGGISEMELIRTQFINDGIVERASPRILEINSTLFHKIKGFKSLMQAGQDDNIVKYVAALADLRGIYGDGITDAEDDIVEIAQSLSNLADCDEITKKRLCMVTGIPKSVMEGENSGGLNNTGYTERLVFQDMIENLQFNYMIDPIKRLCQIFKIDGVKFKENQGGTPGERIDFESKVIANAVSLAALGEDYTDYLVKNNVIEKDDYSAMFSDPSDFDA